METIKVSEDESGLIVRAYESMGKETTVNMKTSQEFKAFETNMLEEGDKAIKLDQAIDVYNSHRIEARKLYDLYKLFKDSKHLEATYRIFEKYREDKLIRPYCEQVEELCEYLRRAEERDMVSTAVELVENEDRIDNFEIAKAVAEKYIKERQEHRQKRRKTKRKTTNNKK